jgi:predicted MPP superfamily phosphohydrolase
VLAVLAALCSGIAGYSALRLTEPFALGGLQPLVVVGCALTFGLVALGTVLLVPLTGHRVVDALQVLGFALLGFLSVTATVVATWECLGLLAAGLRSAGLSDSLLLGWETEGSAVKQWIAGGILTGSTTATLVSLSTASRPARINRVEVPISGLNPALVGMRIVQISDIHIGPGIGQRRIAQVVAQCNELDADLIALTGDLADGNADRLRNSAAPLAGLQARHGVWFVTGNHEYYSGVDPWCALVQELGMQVLINESKYVSFRGLRLQVAGVTDPTGGMFKKGHRPELERARGKDDADFRLLLAHQPACAPSAAALGFDLQLSGHTHGGQYFPFTLLVHLVQRFVAGLYRTGGMTLYVHRGTTWWGPPMRLGSRHEVALLELTQGLSAQDS